MLLSHPSCLNPRRNQNRTFSYSLPLVLPATRGNLTLQPIHLSAERAVCKVLEHPRAVRERVEREEVCWRLPQCEIVQRRDH